MLADIADQLEWAGAKRDLEVWKRLLVAAWLRARGESVEVLPALDGHGIDKELDARQSWTRPNAQSCWTSIWAWAIERMSSSSEAKQWQVDPVTGRRFNEAVSMWMTPIRRWLSPVF